MTDAKTESPTGRRLGVFLNLNPCGLLARTMDGRNCVLQEPLEYLTLGGLHLRVPAFSPTDGRSSPRGTWNIVPPFGKGWYAWVLHDGCYKGLVEILCDDGQWRPFMPTKQQSDDLLHEAMQGLGCEMWETLATFEAVAKFGQDSFDEDRKQLADSVR